MKKIVVCFFICIYALSFINCLPTVAGGLLLNKSAKTKHERQVFITEFNKNNLEREKAGLLRLDLCIAKYQFDKGWAKKDGGCKAKIAAYQRGEIDECGKIIKKNTSQSSQNIYYYRF
jgi:hypothetical protein